MAKAKERKKPATLEETVHWFKRFTTVGQSTLQLASN
jgi:hypothetical protein